MTGKVTSFYLNDSSNRIYCHTDYVSDTAALYGECIRGYHNEGKYYLTQNETDLAYYKKRMQRLFSKAKPLMKTYRTADKDAFFCFEDSEALSGGTRFNILSCLSIRYLKMFWKVCWKTILLEKKTRQMSETICSGKGK